MPNSRSRIALVGTGIAAFAVAMFLGLIVATSLRAQSLGQRTAGFEPEFTYSAASMQATQSGNSNAAAQPRTVSADDPKFAPFVYDVVSIKPHDPKSTDRRMGIWESPDGLTFRAAGVDFMIGMAYQTAHSRLSGAPSWAPHETYDVEAKMEPDVADALQKLSPAERKVARHHMLQVLVRDYLKASVHMESTEVSVYDLVIAKKGPKLKEVTDAALPSQGITVSISPAGRLWTDPCIELATLTQSLSYMVDRPVFDATGLSGRYDITLKFMPDSMSRFAVPRDGGAAPPLDAAPPLANALEEQLGLKLVPAKGNVDVIAIDHVERPSEN